MAGSHEGGTVTDPSPGTFLARILGPGGRPAGVGTLVADGCVLTCAHVVNVALGLDPRRQERPDGPVTLDFPLAGGGPP